MECNEVYDESKIWRPCVLCWVLGVWPVGDRYLCCTCGGPCVGGGTGGTGVRVRVPVGDRYLCSVFVFILIFWAMGWASGYQVIRYQGISIRGMAGAWPGASTTQLAIGLEHKHNTKLGGFIVTLLLIRYASLLIVTHRYSTRHFTRHSTPFNTSWR